MILEEEHSQEKTLLLYYVIQIQWKDLYLTEVVDGFQF